MTTLTDRYIAAALRAVPAADRAEIGRELHAMIADAVQAHAGNGEPDDGTIESVLTELGDPTRLAASFTGRPGFLIGPTYYFDYVRLLKLLLVVVLPISTIAYFFVQVFATGELAASFGSTTGVAITIGVHLCFWTTLAFALGDRKKSGKAAGATWNLSMLPDLTVGRFKFADTIWLESVFVVVGAAVVWQQLYGIVPGTDIPLFDPELWHFWLPVFFALLLAELIYELVKYRVGHWTYALAATNAVIAVAGAVFTAALVINEQVINPAFRDLANWHWSETTTTAVHLAVAIAVAVGAAWSTVDGFAKARRAVAARS